MFSSITLGALAALFTVLAALSGLWAWGKSYFEGKAKDAAIEQFQRDAVAKQTQFETQLETQRTKTEEYREKAATAELQLKQLAAHQGPRSGLIGRLVRALDNKMVGKAEILYQEGDGEVLDFAHLLQIVLKIRGWDVPLERPIGDTVSGSYSGIPLSELRKWAPPRRLGASSTGVSIVTNKKMFETVGKDEPSPFKDLMRALAEVDIALGSTHTDSGLPDDMLRIVIAPR